MKKTVSEKAKRILVVDDDDMLLCTLEAMLEIRGHSVDTAHNGTTAFRKLSGGRYDMVLTDLHMPGMNGLELLDRISKANINVAPVLMSSLLSAEIRQYASRKGAVAQLDKPFAASNLFAVVENNCGLRRGTIPVA